MRIRKSWAALCLLGSLLLPSTASAQFNWPYKITGGKAVTEVPARPAGQESALNLAAPKMKVVRVAFVGLGMRGPSAVERWMHIPGIQVMALCDHERGRAEKCQDILRKASMPAADIYSGEDGYKELCRRKDIDLVYIAPDWKHHFLVAREAMTHGKHVAIEVPAYEYTTAHDLLERARSLGRTPLLVALDQVTDPHNLGAVLRSAGAFGADGVIIPERRSVGVNATVWKVSAGAAARVRVARETNLVRTLGQLKKEGCFVVGLDGAGSTDIEDLTLADSPLVLVTGAEGAGLSRLVRETCDVLASVPISRSVESLNAAVATGISLYEVDRLRRRAAGSTS